MATNANITTTNTTKNPTTRFAARLMVPMTRAKAGTICMYRTTLKNTRNVLMAFK